VSLQCLYLLRMSLFPGPCQAEANQPLLRYS